MGLQKQTHKRSWIDLENVCKVFYLVQHDNCCLKYHRVSSVWAHSSLWPRIIVCMQVVSKGQRVSLSNAEGAVRKALPLVMYHPGENVTKIPSSFHVQVSYWLLRIFTCCQDAQSVLGLEKTNAWQRFSRTLFTLFARWHRIGFVTIPFGGEVDIYNLKYI